MSTNLYFPSLSSQDAIGRNDNTSLRSPSFHSALGSSRNIDSPSSRRSVLQQSLSKNAIRTLSRGCSNVPYMPNAGIRVRRASSVQRLQQTKENPTYTIFQRGKLIFYHMMSLQWSLVIIFTALLLLSNGLILVLSFQENLETAEVMERNLQSIIGQCIVSRIKERLQIAEHRIQLLRGDYNNGWFDNTTWTSPVHWIFPTVAVQKLRRARNVYFTDLDGSIYGSGYDFSSHELGVWFPVNKTEMYHLEADEYGDPTVPPVVFDHYSANVTFEELPWVKYVNLSDPISLTWSPMYTWNGWYALSLSAVVHDPAGNLNGVVALDLHLPQIQSVLVDNIQSNNTRIFLVNLEDETVLAIAANTNATFFSQTPIKIASLTHDVDVSMNELISFEYGSWKNVTTCYPGCGFTLNVPDQDLYYMAINPFSIGTHVNLAVVQLNLRQDVMSAHTRSQQSVLVIDYLLIAGSALVAMLIIANITRPVDYIANSMEEMFSSVFSERAGKSEEESEETLIRRSILEEPSSLKEIRGLQQAFQAMKRTVTSFSKFVPLLIVDRIVAGQPLATELYVERRRLSIFFSDLISFTALAESIDPAILIQLLSEYLDMCTTIINHKQGFVGDFIGDAIMAFHGAPDEVPKHAIKACDSALRQKAGLIALNQRWAKRNIPPLGARMGIHTGEALAGNIGSRIRLKYGIVGDTVNLASKLESLNKRYATSILISNDTLDELNGEFVTRPLEQVLVRGLKSPVEIHELLGRKGGVSSHVELQASQFTILYTQVYNTEYASANKSEIQRELTLYLSTYPEDLAAVLLLERLLSETIGPTRI